MKRTSRTVRSASEREGPNRRASGAFFADAPGPNGSDFRKAADTISDAVETAYRVFDDYLRIGREFAEGRPLRRDGDPMTDKTTNPMTAAMQAWLDLAQYWMGPFMNTMGRAAGATRPDAWDVGGPDRNGGPRAAGNPAGHPVVSLDVSAHQPTRVKVDLHPGATVDRLSVQPLRPLDAEAAPPLEAVDVKTTDGGVVLSIVVPRDQPAGAYAGLLVDRDGKTAVGTVTVTVDAAP